MKTSTQLKALVKNLANEKNVEAEIILRNYMLERLLERISLSRYKDNFILKGGMLIAAMVGIDTRTTMDLDATIKGRVLNKEEIERIFNEIIHIKIDDNINMKLVDIENIREEADYPGTRVSIEAILDKTKQILKIDITTGDYITPREIEYNFGLMFEERKIAIRAYNLETVLAEKLETILTRGTTNTRMRDFYDIYILISLQRKNIDEETFSNAFVNTSTKRGTIEQLNGNFDEIIEIIEKSKILIDLWKRYQNKYIYAKDIYWSEVISSIKVLIEMRKK